MSAPEVVRLHRYGHCRECGITYRLNSDGTIRAHWYGGIAGYPGPMPSDRCPGIRRLPLRWHWGTSSIDGNPPMDGPTTLEVIAQ